MKILTWNCNGALRKKFTYLKEFKADIFVVQECENPESVKDSKYREWSRKYIWTGENNSKGLGIFADENVVIEELDWKTGGLKYFIACKVNNDFILLGTWCHRANSPTFGYIGQLWKYLQIHKSKLKRAIIAGDFNSNVIWDKFDRGWNHSDVVRELKELKIESLYHKHFRKEQGKESKPTFYLHRNPKKPYHIDYVFASEEFSKSVKKMKIGRANKWLEISDHMPVFCDIQIS